MNGIIYIMTTSVDGLIKIGKTNDFKNRMASLEQNGYWNVSGLRRFYAVKVDDYDAKEKLIHTVFSKSQVANSELFALDKNIAKSMLDAFDGIQVYPESTPSDTRKSPRNPSTFAMLGIPIGSELIYIPNPEIKVITVDDKNKVKHPDGTVKSISGMVCYIEDRSFHVNGNTKFMYKDKTLSNIRDELGL